MSGISALERLMFTVGLHDMVSDPLNNINRTLTGVRRNATSGFDAIRGGAVGLGASFLSIKTLMEPVYEMDNALGEVRSLGVIEQELDTLKTSALNFSVAYGESAADFVKSSYDIQSAIGGLTNGELASFTEASNILAKGTKADAATITGYMGTMYGIFGQQAEQMGKAEWVQQLTGQTAAAVQMFKTTGQEMSGAFTALGANAQSAGIKLSEQMAILGTMQATMSGSEAGTKYKAFLSGVGTAQEKLGLTFTDSAGRMLPMLQILDKIKGKFGDVLSVAESDALKQAFGSDEAVSLIKQLMGNTDGLNDSLTKLGRITGMKNAEDMAKAMVDPWEQFEAATIGVRIAFGSALLPTINDVLAKLTDGLTVIMGWTQEFPHLTKAIGLTTLGVLLLGGAVGLMAIVVGISRTAWAGLIVIMAILKAGVWLVVAPLAGLVALWGLLTAAVAAGTMPIWGAFLLFVGVVGIVGRLIYLVGEVTGLWDWMTKVMADTWWGQPILDLFDLLGKQLNWWWEKLKSIVGSIGELMGWLGEDISPKVIPEMPSLTGGQISTIDDLPDISGLDALTTNRPNTGAAREHVTEMLKGGGGTNWGGVTIHTNGGMTPAQLEQWAALNGG